MENYWRQEVEHTAIGGMEDSVGKSLSTTEVLRKEYS